MENKKTSPLYALGFREEDGSINMYTEQHGVDTTKKLLCSSDKEKLESYGKFGQCHGNMREIELIEINALLEANIISERNLSDITKSF